MDLGNSLKHFYFANTDSLTLL